MALFSAGSPYCLMAGPQRQSLHCLDLIVHETPSDGRLLVTESDSVDVWRVG